MTIFNDDMKRELIKISLDKFLIGLLLLVAGIFANNLVEKYKLEEGFRTELNKTRVTRIGEVWESLYVYEASVDNVVNQFTQIIIDTKNDEKQEYERKQKELPPLFKTQELALAHLIATTHKNRFWIGEEIYLEIIDYSNILEETMSAYANYNVDKINELNDKRRTLRQGVISIRDKLLGE